MIPSELKGKVSVSCTGIHLIKKYICLDDMHFFLSKLDHSSWKWSDRIWLYRYRTVEKPHVCCSSKLTNFYLLVLNKCWSNCFFPVLLLRVFFPPKGTTAFSLIACDADGSAWLDFLKISSWKNRSFCQDSLNHVWLSFVPSQGGVDIHM